MQARLWDGEASASARHNWGDETDSYLPSGRRVDLQSPEFYQVDKQMSQFQTANRMNLARYPALLEHFEGSASMVQNCSNQLNELSKRFPVKEFVQPGFLLKSRRHTPNQGSNSY